MVTLLRHTFDIDTDEESFSRIVGLISSKSYSPLSTILSGALSRKLKLQDEYVPMKAKSGTWNMSEKFTEIFLAGESLILIEAPVRQDLGLLGALGGGTTRQLNVTAIGSSFELLQDQLADLAKKIYNAFDINPPDNTMVEKGTDFYYQRKVMLCTTILHSLRESISFKRPDFDE